MNQYLKKSLLILLAIMTMFAVAACGQVSDPDVDPTTEVVVPTATKEAAPAEADATATEESPEEPEIVLAESLDLNIAVGNNNRTITYQQSTPLELPDGTVISQGELKGTWQYIQEQLGFQINDVALQDQTATEMMDVAAATRFDGATVFGGNSVAQDFMAYGAQGYFVRLNDYLDQMPNFAAYLEENPNIAKAITAYDGGIYHIPYAAELGNYARVLCGREAWVIALLDSDEAFEGETDTLTPAYEGFWDRNATNVIALQNEAADGTLTRDVARDVLLAYIADTYPDLAKPSDLYLNDTAKYDIDELVALWRVVKLSPNTLSKVTTGDVVADTVISPFFVRQTSYREDYLRLLQYFGQRVHGSDSYTSRFYLDADGVLQFSYAEDKFLEGVGYLAQIYSEGLVHSEFADLSNSERFRNPLYSEDDVEGSQRFGFMTLDWIASTTAANEDVVGMLPPLTKMGSDEFIYFNENTRVIKPDGWVISAASSPEEINAALALFDYFFSEEGNVVQNYGPPWAREEGGVFEGMDEISYPKFAQWTLDTACELKNCDVSGFLRDFVGSQIPIGYQKEIGFEWQYTKNRGWDAWSLWIDKPVLSTSYGSEDPLFRLVPPVFSLTEQDSAKLAQLAVGNDQRDAIFLFITGADTAVDSVEALKDLYLEAGIEDYIEVYRNAYARMTE